MARSLSTLSQSVNFQEIRMWKKKAYSVRVSRPMKKTAWCDKTRLHISAFALVTKLGPMWLQVLAYPVSYSFFKLTTLLITVLEHNWKKSFCFWRNVGGLTKSEVIPRYPVQPEMKFFKLRIIFVPFLKKQHSISQNGIFFFKTSNIFPAKPMFVGKRLSSNRKDWRSKI